MQSCIIAVMVKVVPIKTVTAAIDATGHIQKDRWIAIRYVRKDGAVRDLVVRKQYTGRKRVSKATKQRSYRRYKESGNIPVVDKQGQQKTIFYPAIIGFNPFGDITLMHRVHHGKVSR